MLARKPSFQVAALRLRRSEIFSSVLRIKLWAMCLTVVKSAGAWSVRTRQSSPQRLAGALLARPPRGLAVDGDHPLRRAGQCRYPGQEAAMELLGVQHGQDVAEMVVCRGGVRQRSEAAQQFPFIRAEQGDIDQGLAADRTSCSRASANRMRLRPHTAAYCWCGRPPTASMCQNEVVTDLREKRPSVDEVSRNGMDTSKHIFQLHGVDAAEVPVLRKKFRRKEMVTFFEKPARRVIAIEACGASHHWARLLQSFGHSENLIPPQLVKP